MLYDIALSLYKLNIDIDIDIDIDTAFISFKFNLVYFILFPSLSTHI